MPIAANNVTGGPATGAPNAGDTSASFTSVANSLIVDFAGVYNTAGSPAGTDTTDSKSNTYSQFDVNNVPSVNQPGIETNYNNAGTRGTSHTVTSNGPGSGDFNFTDVIEVTGHDPSNIFDATLTAHSNQTFTTAWSVTTAAAPGPGTTMLIACFHADTGVNSTITDPSGWTLIWKKTNGSSEVVNCAYYKIVTNPGSAQTCAPTWGGANGDITRVVGTIIGVNEAKAAAPILDWTVNILQLIDKLGLDGVAELLWKGVEQLQVGIIQAVGTAVETDSALAIGRIKTRAVGVAAETDSALALGVAHSRIVGIAVETDSALAIGRIKTRAVGIATETDSALSLGKTHTRAVGTATETDSAIAIGARIKTRLVGVAVENDVALPIGGSQVTVGMPSQGLHYGQKIGIPRKVGR